MIKKCTPLLIIVLSAIIYNPIFAQLSFKDLLSKGELYMGQKRYEKAIKCFEKCNELKPKERSVKEILAYSYLQGSQIQNAIRIYNSLVIIDGFDSPKNLLNFAKAFHHNLQFKEAATYYKKFLSKAKKDDPNIAYVNHELKRCSSGNVLNFENTNTIVENLGENINTALDEIGPIFSPNNDSKIYFSSNPETANGGLRNQLGVKDEQLGNYCLDMMMSESDNGEWSKPVQINALLNSPKHDILMDFGKKGQVALFKKSLDGITGPIYSDTFSTKQRDIINPKQVSVLPIVGEKGDKDIFVLNDTLILFASKRDGGFGGYDLYITLYSKGKWQKAINLGNIINSSFDEVSPFLSGNGRTLYYSSNNDNSIGGFDVFMSKFDDFSNQWKTPSNQGVPLNSAADDLNFRLSKNGNFALLSSDRKTGFGGFDIYSCLFQNAMSDLMASNTPPYFFQIKDFKEGKFLPTIEPSLATTLASATNLTIESAILPDLTVSIQDTSSTKPQAGIDNTLTQHSNNASVAQANNPTTTVDQTLPNNAAEISAAYVREFSIQPLFYTDKEKTELSRQNMDKLESLIEIIKLDTSIRVNITAHTEQYGSKNFSLYSGIKMSELAANFLISKGVLSDKIYIRSLGDNYPEAKNIINGKPNIAAKWLNKRMDITLHNVKNPYLRLNYEFPAVSEMMKEPIGRAFQQMQEGLSYKVQFASLKQLYSGILLDSKSDPMVERLPNIPFYRYSVGFFKKFQDAESFKETLLAEGIKDAYVIAYLDGLKITSDMVNGELVRKYPDLKLFFRLGE